MQKVNWDAIWLLYVNGVELCELCREATGIPERPKHGTLRNYASKNKWGVKRELVRAEKRLEGSKGDRADRELQEPNTCPPSYDKDTLDTPTA